MCMQQNVVFEFGIIIIRIQIFWGFLALKAFTKIKKGKKIASNSILCYNALMAYRAPF